jgi:2-methylisocitrate lyase-like PEP mutase family enzyme
MIYPDAIRSENDIERVIEAAGGVPVSINMGFGIRARPTTPLVSLKRLAELGVARVTAPRMLPAAALSGMRNAMQAMRDAMGTGEIVDRPDLAVGMEDITALMNYERVDALEREFLLEEEIEHKYREGNTGFVIR